MSIATKISHSLRRGRTGRWTQKGIDVAPAYRLENAPVLMATFDSHKGNG